MQIRRRWFSNFVCLLGLATGLFAAPAVTAAPAESTSDRSASMVIEAATGRVLWADNPDALRRPASLAKLMTLYLTFEALRDRRISLDEQVPFSDHAASMIPTKLGVPAGGAITVQEAILSMVTLSANDAAAAMGELLGGSEERFAQLMTLRARALGMSQTTFRNASGLPDPDQWTTARDMAILARRLISDFPREYSYFSVPDFDFHGRIIANHDSELRSYPGADGLKTGYTLASGHNLVTSAVREGVRLIGVEFGAPSNAIRDMRMTAMLNAGYEALGIVVPQPTTPVALAVGVPALMPSARASERSRPVARLQHRAARASTAESRRAPSVMPVAGVRLRSAGRTASWKSRPAAPPVSGLRVPHVLAPTRQVLHLEKACTPSPHRRQACPGVHAPVSGRISHV